MPHDQQTYRRAASAAIIGLGVQIALTIAAALIGLWAEAPALYQATWHLLGGLPIWVILFLLYNQRRIERTEALEAEQMLRRDAQAAALFQEHADDLDLARRRVQRLEGIGLGSVSFIVALYLLGVGGYFLYANRMAMRNVAGALGEDVNPLVLMFLAAAIAFIAFIVARYVSGMTGIREWQQLRGGASYLMGNFAVAILIAAAAMLDVAFGNRAFLAWLAFIIPGLMVLVGVEILLTILLSAYRPRKPGEIVRPAFDSRVLGLFTAPESLASIINEAINYQFGFEISRSWFYQLLGKSITPLVAAAILILILISSIVIVAPHQQAVITRFGGIVGDPVGPGLHLKWFWPIGRADKYDVGRVQQIFCGSVKIKEEAGTAILWTNQHASGKEEFLVTAPTPWVKELLKEQQKETGGGGSATAGVGVGVGLVPAEVLVKYRCKPDGLLDYVRTTASPDLLIKSIAERRINAYFSTHDIDYVLAKGRVEAGETLRMQLQADLDRVGPQGKGLGVDVVMVTITSIHPPTGEIADAFHAVINAIHEKETAIQDARAEAIRTLAKVAGSYERGQEIDAEIRRFERIKQDLDEAGAGEAEAKLVALRDQIDKQGEVIKERMLNAQGEISRIADEAWAYRWSREITERAKADRFASELAAYQNAPGYFRHRYYLDILAEGLSTRRKIILATDQSIPPLYRFDFKDAANALDTLLK